MADHSDARVTGVSCSNCGEQLPLELASSHDKTVVRQLWLYYQACRGYSRRFNYSARGAGLGNQRPKPALQEEAEENSRRREDGFRVVGPSFKR